MAFASENELFLTEAEAIAFLKYTLRIDGVEDKIKGPKLDLLQEITKKFHEHIPFQNLTLLSNTKDRHLPTDEEIKTDYFSGIGGVSYTSAIFGYKLLKVLGFETFFVAINVPCTGKSNSHVAFIVKNISFPGERFLVDLGAGYPTLEPVPLHFLPLYYKQTFLEYKFIRQENGLIVRYHKVGDHFQLGKVCSKVCDDGWQKFYEFEEIPREEGFIKKYQRPIYLLAGYGSSWISEGLKLTIYPSTTQAFTISNLELKKWKKGKDVETIELKSPRDLHMAMRKYFPTLVDISLQSVLGLLPCNNKTLSKKCENKHNSLL